MMLSSEAEYIQEDITLEAALEDEYLPTPHSAATRRRQEREWGEQMSEYRDLEGRWNGDRDRD